MSTEARELHRVIRASGRDMLDAYRIQAQAGPVSDGALEGIIFRAAHPVVDRLAPYPAAERAALLPNVVRLLLASFLEDVAGEDGRKEGRRGGTVVYLAPVEPRLCHVGGRGDEVGWCARDVAARTAHNLLMKMRSLLHALRIECEQTREGIDTRNHVLNGRCGSTSTPMMSMRHTPCVRSMVRTCSRHPWTRWRSGVGGDAQLRAVLAVPGTILCALPRPVGTSADSRRIQQHLMSEDRGHDASFHKLRNLERKAPKHVLAEIRDDFHRIVYAANADAAHAAYTAFERTWANGSPTPTSDRPIWTMGDGIFLAGC